MSTLIESISDAVPAALTEVITLGRTLKKRATDVLAYFDRPGTSNGPTEAINGRLEHLRGSALGFRNLTHYIARSLLEAGGFNETQGITPNRNPGAGKGRFVICRTSRPECMIRSGSYLRHTVVSRARTQTFTSLCPKCDSHGPRFLR